MFELLKLSYCISYLFTTSQIDQVQFARQLLLTFDILLFDINKEHTVASGTVLVHIYNKLT